MPREQQSSAPEAEALNSESTPLSENNPVEERGALTDMDEQASQARISITAGDQVIYASLFDNETADSFKNLLPLTLNAFDRIGLVKSTVLPQSISANGKFTREYVRGAVFYWPEGPEVAFCYSDHLLETVVDIIHMGLIETGVEIFEEYTGEIYIELVNQ
ncbi:cyclophilin-like fold protein [Clostridium sp. KNHs205]|uniref:cyclophilin-like fold protein n=1 Tax=Clostridium sp. KNHs205 TaxID=1449050 RepID=UPI00068E626B|nr:cyclophilin-like fold protein [Clostridium sp. KNHs205]